MESKLKFIETSKLPTDVGEFTVHAFTDEKDSKDHLAIGMGDLLTNEPVLSRIHSQCITGESFFSMRCDCRYQLTCLLYTSPSPRDLSTSRMPSSA